MKLRLIDALTVPSQLAGDNEDAYYADQHCAVVLDGVTSMPGQQKIDGLTPPSWYAKQIVAELPQQAAKGSLEEQITSALVQVHLAYVRKAPIGLQTPPMAAMAACALREDKLRILLTGDVEILISQSEKISRYRDKRSDSAETATREQWQLLSNHGISYLSRREIIRPLIRFIRAQINSPGGYSLCSASDPKTWNPVVFETPISLGDKIWIVTDGTARAYTTLEHTGIEQAFYLAQTHGAKHLIEKIREIESSDIDCIKYPRLKANDDATSVLLEVIDD